MDKEGLSYYEQEFNMLKDAHFQTSQKIISFFQFALLIFSAPIALLTSDQISRAVLGTVFIVIGIIEVLVIAYLSSLRTEALLYARQINRIRNVIYSDGVLGKDIADINKKKILFSQDKKPDYKDGNQFVFIVLVLGLFSAFYVAFGSYKLLTDIFGFSNMRCVIIASVIIGCLMLMISYIVHKYIAISAENGVAYYKQIIGVDIDGVLNKHEETFVYVLEQLTGKKYNTEDIRSLPVHVSTDISREEEHSVFETKEYWELQSLNNEVKECLNEEIHNTLGFKTYIFTWRSWNVCKNIKGEDLCFDLEDHTKQWLKTNGIVFNKVKFEKGNYDSPISLFNSRYKTRYYYAQKYKIRYFVEDNVRNAEKLSRICEYVFLIDHPYNQNDKLPYNVIRVSGWKDISEWLKQLN